MAARVSTFSHTPDVEAATELHQKGADIEQRDAARLFALSYKVAFRIVRSLPDAEDIAQDAVVRAFAAWPKVRRYDEAWVVRVTTNLAIDVIRRDARERVKLERSARNGVALQRPSASDVSGQPDIGPFPYPSPEDATTKIAAQLDMADALRRLPRRQREVLVLRYYADLTEDAVAR